MMSVEKRYYNDPFFHGLVQQLEAMLEQLNMTPTEVREACMFAQLRFESRHVRPLTVTRDTLRNMGIMLQEAGE